MKEVLVKSGDIVKKGDPLLQLEVEGLDVDIKYKLLDIEKAKFELENAKQDRNEAEMRVRLLSLILRIFNMKERCQARKSSIRGGDGWSSHLR